MDNLIETFETSAYEISITGVPGHTFSYHSLK